MLVSVYHFMPRVILIAKLKNKSVPRSLATQSRRQMILLGSVVFIGLMILITIFSFYQVDQAMNNYTRLEAVKLEKLIISNPNYTIPYKEERKVYRDWRDIPSEFQQLFEKQGRRSGEVLEAERINPKGNREYVYLIYSNTHLSSGIYILDVEDAKTIDQLVQTIFEKTIFEASLIISLFMLFFFFVIAFIFRRALLPINLLIDWSKKIREKPEEEAVASFSIQELNDIAEDLLSSLQKIKDYNIREKQFLQHASHELRTPLAIIQASLDTLGIRIENNHPNYAALERASRASNNMILLSNALLWLSRQTNRKIEKTKVIPTKICQELMRDLNYLISGKDIKVDINGNDESIVIEEDLFRIILANLIRNAYQHSAPGIVSIQINRKSLSISNPIEQESSNPVQSFGLGLQLIERIAIKLDWKFNLKLEYNQAIVKLIW